KLAQRLYVPESGRVLLMASTLPSSTPLGFAGNWVLCCRKSVLFNRSIRDNIALADPAMSIRQVIGAARLAGAHEFILTLPEATTPLSASAVQAYRGARSSG